MEALAGGLSSRQREPGPLAGVSVAETPRGTTLVRISGHMPAGWMGALSTGVAEAGFAIVRGQARQTERQRWEGELELLAPGPKRRTLAVDYLLLTSRRRTGGALAPIVVEEHAAERRPERRALAVELRGRDRVGFLAGVLERLASLQLFPIEMKVETAGPSALGRFLLQAFGGQEPAADAESRLSALLDGLR